MMYTAHAKINLALHVTGQRDDGYHLLDTLVVFTEFGDQLEVCENPAGEQLVKLSITGPFADGLPADDTNLIVKAATELVDLCGVQPRPVHITLEKNLPLASGIGGGSADAAATLKALADFWNLKINDDAFMQLALSLGADVPMCVRGSPLVARGIGEQITPLNLPQPLSLVLVNPGVSLSTPQVFSKLKNKSNSGICETQEEKFPDITKLQTLRNDLQRPASELCPQIGQVIAALEEQNECQLARMSGSGATCFAIFPDLHLARQAAEKIRSSCPSWWVNATQTTG